MDCCIGRWFRADANSVSVPVPPGTKLKKAEEEFKDPSLFRAVIGSLIYASTCTRPDVSYAVCILSQFMSDPGEEHWMLAKRVLRYLKGSLGVQLVFGGDSGGTELEGFADANWGEDIVDRRSYSGYVFRIGNSLVSWRCRKQPTVAKSSTEAEYMALGSAAQECLWLRSLLAELGLAPGGATTIFEDNQGAAFLAQNPKINDRSKHIDISHHFIRDHIKEGRIMLQHVDSANQLADSLTKPHPRPRLDFIWTSLGVMDIKGEC
jgi:hypothetical protein